MLVFLKWFRMLGVWLLEMGISANQMTKIWVIRVVNSGTELQWDKTFMWGKQDKQIQNI